jgi:hypothetical protein
MAVVTERDPVSALAADHGLDLAVGALVAGCS